MAPIVAALLTAALALVGKIFFDLTNLHRERQGVAAALAGEIGAYLDLLRPETIIPAYRQIATAERNLRIEFFKSYPPLPVGHPVFDKIADKVGLLPLDAAFGVSRVYNIVTGFRILQVSMSAQGFIDAPDAFQIGRLSAIADLIEREIAPAQLLIADLKGVSQENFWRFMLARYPAVGGFIGRLGT
jgi:hypothetical protein